MKYIIIIILALSFNTVAQPLFMGNNFNPASFSNDQAMSMHDDTGELCESTGITESEFRMDENSAWTINFWIKAGWVTSFVKWVPLFIVSDSDGGVWENTVRIYYNDGGSLNRWYIDMLGDNGGNNRSQNFWYAHAGATLGSSGVSNLGSTYWSADNRGNVNDNDFCMLTFTHAGGDATRANVAIYWNGTDGGDAYYLSGSQTGTFNMDVDVNKEIGIGSFGYIPGKSWDLGNPTIYDEVTFWSVELTQSEVDELYSGTKPNISPTNIEDHSQYANLIEWWTFEGTGLVSHLGKADLTFTTNVTTTTPSATE